MPELTEPNVPLGEEEHDDEGGSNLSLQRLDPRVVWFWRLTLLVEAAVLLIGLSVVARFTGAWLSLPLLALAVVLSLALAAVWPPARYRAWGFRMREEDLLVRQGVLSRTVSVIPHARIQHVDTRQDPLERWLGLARVVVYTAGIRGAELAIPGLPVRTADALRDRLADLGRVEHAV